MIIVCRRRIFIKFQKLLIKNKKINNKINKKINKKKIAKLKIELINHYIIYHY